MDFQIGSVINRTISAISRNFAVFSMLALVLVGAPALLAGIAQIFIVAEGNLVGSGLVVFVAAVVNFVTVYILQGALVHGAIVDYNGGRARFGDCLSTGLKHFFPLLIIAVLTGLAVAVGMLLLVVPGLILAVMLVIAAPARVVENAGIMEALGRSRELTRNNRWKIFWLFVVYLLIALVIGVVIAIPAGVFAVGVAGVTAVSVIIEVVGTVATSVISAAGVAALYFELRQSKEGVGAEALAKVFD